MNISRNTSRPTYKATTVSNNVPDDSILSIVSSLASAVDEVTTSTGGAAEAIRNAVDEAK